MKKLNYLKFLVLLVVASSLVFVACTDEDDDDKTNYIMYDGDEDVLNGGIIEYYGQLSGSGYNFDITLLSDKSALESNVGVISGIYFEMFSDSDAELTDGTYTYDSDLTEEPFTFDYADFVFNYDIETENGIEDSFSSGSVIIKKSGSIYTIDFDGTTEDGKKIEGNYTGTLDDDDYSRKSAPVKNNFIK